LLDCGFLTQHRKARVTGQNTRQSKGHESDTKEDWQQQEDPANQELGHMNNLIITWNSALSIILKRCSGHSDS
jgi:uncharacterized membrane protein YkoI